MATGMPGGIGLPHARSEHVTVPSLAVGRVAAGVDFGAPDGRLSASGAADPAELPREATGLADLVLEGRPRDFARGDGRHLVPALAPLVVVAVVLYGAGLAAVGGLSILRATIRVAS